MGKLWNEQKLIAIYIYIDIFNFHDRIRIAVIPFIDIYVNIYTKRNRTRIEQNRLEQNETKRNEMERNQNKNIHNKKKEREKQFKFKLHVYVYCHLHCCGIFFFQNK